MASHLIIFLHKIEGGKKHQIRVFFTLQKLRIMKTFAKIISWVAENGFRVGGEKTIL